MGKCYFCSNEADKKYGFEYEGKQIQSYVCDECVGKIEKKSPEGSKQEPKEGDFKCALASVLFFFASAIAIIASIAGNDSSFFNTHIEDFYLRSAAFFLGIFFGILGGIFVVAYYCSKISNNMGNFK